MKYILLIFTLFVGLQGSAQDTTGSIVGKMTDKELNDEPLAFANVLIKGTTQGTTSDFDGLYEISGVEPGVYTVVFSYLGYETIEIPNVEVVADKVTSIDVPMRASSGFELDEVVVTTVSRKDSEAALLLDQKKATEIKTSIGAQELARKGVSDVAAAVTKTTGISKQEGSGSIFVRGLGDRYNITTMNGLPLPSNNPSMKNIDLNIFSTDIVESIGIDKTYVVRNYGDFAGANIDIVSKDYKGEGFLSVGLGTGINSEATSVDQFYLNDGPNKSGFYDIIYPASPLSNYNFTTSWDRTEASSPINLDISLRAGDSFQLGENGRLSIFGVASHSNDYNYNEGVTRGSVNVSGLARRDYTYNTFKYNTNTTLLGNIGYRTPEHKLLYNALMVNTTTQQQQEYFGIVDVFDYAPEGGAFVQRALFDRTVLVVHQLLGEHSLSDNLEVNWGGAYNFVENDVPNRRQIVLTPDDWDVPEGPKSFQETLNSSDNHRFYQNLEEEEVAANMAATYKFKEDAEEGTFGGKLTLGYSGKFKTVDFEAIQFNFNITQRNPDNSIVDQPIVDDIYNVDAYFNQENLNAGLFSIATFRGGLGTPNVLDPQTYDGTQDIHAGFLNLEYAFNPKFTITAGLRGEQINQTIEWSTSLDPTGDKSEFDTFEILPSLSIKYALNEKQNLRFAASKTYTLPQFKERALFQFEEVTQVYFGNPSLYASTDYNVDVKWELFPKSTELVSLGLFGKLIQDPINSVTVNSATNDISYVNSGDQATALGAEFELRKSIFERETELEDYFAKENLTLGFNMSYMTSDQDLDAEKVVTETTEAGILPLSVDFSNDSDRISGASDLLLNGDLSYYKEFKKDKNILVTLAYNYFSDRIYALGTEGKGNLVDKGFGTLDFVARANLNKHIGLSLTAKNLLNPEIERFQETQDVTVLSYQKGQNIKLSLTYNF
ncbi:TonB-dependent receptor domain-containing protein [Flagellimonas sp.]|uniref:TonB-dependent receptor n=1 Tax=Flagellimonas sp. TaxID=2058762 RepID=UPI003B5CA9F3